MDHRGNSGAAGVFSIGGSQNGGSQTPIIDSSYPGAAANSNTGHVPRAYSTSDSHGHHLGDVVMSNEFDNPITAPHPGNGLINGHRFKFRQGQAVQFTPAASAISGTGASSYVITPTVWASNGNVITEGSITYTITDFSALDLGGIFALSWAMSCGNDVIQGVVDFTPIIPGGGGEVPIPTTLPLLAAGLGILGLTALRRKRRQLSAFAA